MTVDQLEEPVEYEGRSLQELVVLTKKGDFAAQYEIGRRFLHGTGGAKQDYPFALQMITPAAHKGYPQAQYTLGLMYGKGLGTEQDTEKAAEWYKKAALQGHSQAKLRLEEWIPSGRKEAPTPHEESRYLGENEDNDGFSMEDFEYVDDEGIEFASDEEYVITNPEIYRMRAVVEALSGNMEAAVKEANEAVKYSQEAEEYARFKLELMTGKDASKVSVKYVKMFIKICENGDQYTGGFNVFAFLFPHWWMLAVGCWRYAGIYLVCGYYGIMLMCRVPNLLLIVFLAIIVAERVLLGIYANRLYYRYFLKYAKNSTVFSTEEKQLWEKTVAERGEEGAKQYFLGKREREEKIRKMKENINRAVAGNPMVRKAIWQLLEGIVRSIFR